MKFVWSLQFISATKSQISDICNYSQNYQAAPYLLVQGCETACLMITLLLPQQYFVAN